MRAPAANGLAGLWLAAALGAGAGCAQDANTESYELSGKVVDATDDVPLGKVRITFVSDTLEQASGRTGGGGVYEMRVESQTPFGQVRAEKDGWRAAEKTVYFDMPRRRIDFALRPAPTDGEED